MSSSIQSILLKEKQIEEEISKYQLKIESKIDKLKSKKLQEKKELILSLEEKNMLSNKKMEDEVKKKCEVLINNTTESSKKISYNSYFDSLILKINTEFNLDPTVNNGGMNKK